MTEVARSKDADKGSLTPRPAARRRGEKILPRDTLLASNFLVEDVIGEGGMAVVYAARQKSLNRVVAIKVLHSRYVRDPEFVSRFEDEAGALAALSHPNVVNIIDRGNDGGRYFFVMEHVQGKTLDQHIIEDTLTIKEWREVVTACRDALEYVHRNGVVHRDIKPSNILIGPDMIVKIGDFGIAHIVEGEDEDRESGARQARALGTQNYMAPEQIEDSAHVDHRADIYSLGVTFYKMLARALPVGEYQMPSESNHNVPVAVDAVICKAMNEDRDQRYQTVRQFCDDLLTALKEQTVSITSVLNYRNSPTPANALYTGADFRSTPVPSSAKQGQGGTPGPVKRMLTPKPVSPSKQKRKADSRQTPRGEPAKDGRAGNEPGRRVSTAVPVDGAGDSGSTAKQGSMKGLAIAATSVALVLIAAILFVLSKGSQRPAEAPATDHTIPISEQQDLLREEIIREKKERLSSETPGWDTGPPTVGELEVPERPPVAPESDAVEEEAENQ